MTNEWQIVPEKSTEFTLEIKDPEGWRSAQVKWDGCVHYYRYYNTPMGMNPRNDEDRDYIHLCDVDEEIARLQALKRIAYNYFEQQGRADHNWQPEIIEGNVVQVIHEPETIKEQRARMGLPMISPAAPPFPDRPSLQNIIQEGTISTIPKGD